MSALLIGVFAAALVVVAALQDRVRTHRLDDLGIASPKGKKANESIFRGP